MMVIGTMIIKLHAPWVHSLKEKRMVVKSISAKVSNKFNASVAEVAEQDLHQSIVLGIACVTTSVAHGDSILDTIINFVESNTEAEIIEIQREII